MTEQQTTELKRAYVTLADMGRYDYAVDGCFVFEIEDPDRTLYPALKNSGITHIVIYKKGRLEFGVEFLQLTLPSRIRAQAARRLPVHASLPAVSGLPVGLGAVYTFTETL